MFSGEERTFSSPRKMSVMGRYLAKVMEGRTLEIISWIEQEVKAGESRPVCIINQGNFKNNERQRSTSDEGSSGP